MVWPPGRQASHVGGNSCCLIQFHTMFPNAGYTIEPTTSYCDISDQHIQAQYQCRCMVLCSAIAPGRLGLSLSGICLCCHSVSSGACIVKSPHLIVGRHQASSGVHHTAASKEVSEKLQCRNTNMSSESVRRVKFQSPGVFVVTPLASHQHADTGAALKTTKASLQRRV